MTSFFGPDFFSQNRTKLREAIDSDMPIVVTSNGTMQRSGDEPFKFVQDSNFWYLTGLNAPDLVLVMTTKDSYLIVPTLSFEREAFDGQHDRAAYEARSGITAYLDERAGWQQLKTDLQTAHQVATLLSPPSYLKRHGLHTLPYRRRLIEKLKRMEPGVTIRDVRPELSTLRCIKQPEELQALQRAIDITSETLMDLVNPETLGVAQNEYELEAHLSYGFRHRGGEGHAFSPITAAGKHATTLHHMQNDGPIRPNDLIVVDVGAEAEHYSADITRTISQQPITGRAAAVFNAVAATQDYAYSLIKPGVLPREYEQAVEAFMGTQLQQLGLIQKATHEAIRHYFPHATSHFLGLDTHDVGNYQEPWQENMVITVEPGIYIPEEGIGVRIEDDVRITANGCEVLSRACPRQLSPVQ